MLCDVTALCTYSICPDDTVGSNKRCQEGSHRNISVVTVIHITILKSNQEDKVYLPTYMPHSILVLSKTIDGSNPIDQISRVVKNCQHHKKKKA